MFLCARRGQRAYSLKGGRETGDGASGCLGRKAGEPARRRQAKQNAGWQAGRLALGPEEGGGCACVWPGLKSKMGRKWCRCPFVPVGSWLRWVLPVGMGITVSEVVYCTTMDQEERKKKTMEL